MRQRIKISVDTTTSAIIPKPGNTYYDVAHNTVICCEHNGKKKFVELGNGDSYNAHSRHVSSNLDTEITVVPNLDPVPVRPDASTVGVWYTDLGGRIYLNSHIGMVNLSGGNVLDHEFVKSCRSAWYKLEAITIESKVK